MPAYQDRSGLWHITTRDQGRLTSLLNSAAGPIEPFTLSSGNLYGHETHSPRGTQTMGQLAANLHHAAINSSYTVYSYATPLVWLDTDSRLWFAPPVHYSPTSDRHYRFIVAALAPTGQIFTNTRAITDARIDPRLHRRR